MVRDQPPYITAYQSVLRMQSGFVMKHERFAYYGTVTDIYIYISTVQYIFICISIYLYTCNILAVGGHL